MRTIFSKKLQQNKREGGLTASRSVKGDKGVALLFVVLLTSVLFVVALGIQNVAYKELIFSLEARDSGLAFFAADTGIECGLYLWKNNPNMWLAPTSFSLPGSGSMNITCNGLNPLNIDTGGGGIGNTSHFAIPLGSECVEVSVQTVAGTPSAPGGLPYYPIITAQGYNTKMTGSTGSTRCLPITGTTPANLVSRVLQVSLPL